jgi:hypothetical protein
MKLNFRLPVLAALLLLAAAGCKDTTGPRLPSDGEDPDNPPPVGQAYVAPVAAALNA